MPSVPESGGPTTLYVNLDFLDALLVPLGWASFSAVASYGRIAYAWRSEAARTRATLI